MLLQKSCSKNVSTQSHVFFNNMAQILLCEQIEIILHINKIPT